MELACNLQLGYKLGVTALWMSQVLQVRELNLDELYDVKKLPSSAKFFQWCLKIVEKELASNLGKLTFSLWKNQAFQMCFLFSSLLAWHGEMLYVVRMQSFFWNSQNIANLVFCFEKAALQCVNKHTWANAMFKHVRTFVIRTKPWTRKPRKRRTRNRSEMLTYLSSR